LPIERKRIFFATMANDHPVILSFIRESGIGVFVNSLAHLRLVRELGFRPEQIVFAASNMNAEEMKACVEERVNLVLDSIGQIETLGKVANRPLEIGVRLNVGSALDGGAIRHDPAYRFGLLVDELPQAIRIARARQIKIIGAHSYFGTGVMKPEILLQGLECLGIVAANLPDLLYLDVGGGFGVPDALDGAEFNIREYGRQAGEIMRRHEERVGRNLALYIEPGRYLAADSGYFFVKVIDCKIREDRVFVGTNGSVANFPRPLMYPDRAHHPCEILSDRGKLPVHSTPVYVCGNSTYSQDFLARNISLPLPEPGDTLVFHNAGAYGRSMITYFLGKDRPEEVVIEKVEAASPASPGR
jgi:diaminopimelate decarboxylase